MLSDVLAGIAILTGAVAYGAEVFALVVLRPALAGADDRTLTTRMGEIHRYGDRRMPIPFAVALVAATLSAGAAAVEGRTVAAISAAIAAGMPARLAGSVLAYERPPSTASSQRARPTRSSSHGRSSPSASVGPRALHPDSLATLALAALWPRWQGPSRSPGAWSQLTGEVREGLGSREPWTGRRRAAAFSCRRRCFSPSAVTSALRRVTSPRRLRSGSPRCSITSRPSTEIFRDSRRTRPRALDRPDELNASSEDPSWAEKQHLGHRAMSA